MTNLVPFNQSQAPAHLRIDSEQVKMLNAGAAAGTGGNGCNKISLKQCRFRLIVGGNEVAVLPVVSLDVVALRTNDAASKTFYETAWNPNDEPTQPDCSSDDGIRPRTDSAKPQCGPDGLCQNCPQNQWGSKINPHTQAKGKRCADTKRVAIIAPGGNGRFDTNADAYQLNIPAASLGEWGTYVRGLSSMTPAVPYNAVVTRVSFDTKADFPRLLFEGVRYLDDAEYQHVSGRYAQEITCRTAGLPDPATVNTGAPRLGHQGDQQQAPQNQQQAPQNQQQQAPQHQQQQAPQNQGGWGEQQNQQQQAPQNQQQQAPQNQQQAQGQARVPGQPSPGKTRRTSAEVAEDKALAEQGQHQQQQAPQHQQQQAPQNQGGWGEQQQQQAPQNQQQQAPQNQQQQAPQNQGGWGEQQNQQQQAPQNQQQQAPQNQGVWGEQQQQAPQHQQQQAPQNQGGWGEQQQQAPQNQQQQAPQNQQQAQGQARVPGQPSPGKTRRTSAEVAEDKALAEQGQHQQQQAPQNQQQAPQNQGGWGEQQQQQAPQHQQQQAPQNQGGWGEQQQQQAPQHQQQQAPQNQGSWGNQQQTGPSGAPEQPNLAVGGGFQGWDDQQ